MSSYQHKSSNYHLTNIANKTSWPSSSVSCNAYGDGSSNKSNSTKNNVVHAPVPPQFSHNYNDYTKNNPFDNQLGSYMPTSGVYYGYPRRVDSAINKNFIQNDKRHNGSDGYGNDHYNPKKPRVEETSSCQRNDDLNGCDTKGAIAPQVASAISSHKNKSKSYLLSSGLKNYIRQQNDRGLRNASETYCSNSHNVSELFVNQESEFPLSSAMENVFSNVESNGNDDGECNSDDIRLNFNTNQSKLQNSNTTAGIKDKLINNKSSNGINNITTTSVDDQNNSKSRHLLEFLESDYWKKFTSEDFMIETKDMYKNFVSQYRPIVNDLVDKAKSKKKEDRDNLAMDMWQLGCLENTIRNKKENIELVQAKMFSLIQSLEARKFILNNIEKTIQEGKSSVYKAAEK